MAVGLILGSGFERLFAGGARDKAWNRFGHFHFRSVHVGGARVLVIPRHGFRHELPPHALPTKAEMFWFRQQRIEKVIAVSAVGSANKDLPPGSIAVVDQFIDLTRQRDSTFYRDLDAVVHTDFTEPFCAVQNNLLTRTAAAHNVALREGIVYAGTEGPRYETPAEVTMIRRLGGDIVGHSAVPEAILARELGVCYSLVAVVSNWAAGGQATISSRDIIEFIWQHSRAVETILESALPSLSRTRRRASCRTTSVDGDALYAVLASNSSRRTQKPA